MIRNISVFCKQSSLYQEAMIPENTFQWAHFHPLPPFCKSEQRYTCDQNPGTSTWTSLVQFVPLPIITTGTSFDRRNSLFTLIMQNCIFSPHLRLWTGRPSSTCVLSSRSNITSKQTLSQDRQQFSNLSTNRVMQLWGGIRNTSDAWRHVNCVSTYMIFNTILETITRTCSMFKTMCRIILCQR